MPTHVPHVSLALIVYARACMQDGFTPLTGASGRGHHEPVEFLLAHKADVNVKDKVSWVEGYEGVP